MKRARRAAAADPSLTVHQHFPKAGPQLFQQAKRPPKQGTPHDQLMPIEENDDEPDEADTDVELDDEDDTIGPGPDCDAVSHGDRADGYLRPRAYGRSGANVATDPAPAVVGRSSGSYDPRARPASARVLPAGSRLTRDRPRRRCACRGWCWQSRLGAARSPVRASFLRPVHRVHRRPASGLSAAAPFIPGQKSLHLLTDSARLPNVPYLNLRWWANLKRPPCARRLKMAKHSEYFVESHEKGWAVELPHAERASAIAGTQKAAIERAKELAPEGVVHVKPRDGKFRRV
jgi:Uncharacterized protein conserved in bacteria (DUF2188)